MKQIIFLLTFIATTFTISDAHDQALESFNNCIATCKAKSVPKPTKSTYVKDYSGKSYTCPSWADNPSYSAYCQGLLLWSDATCYQSCVYNAIHEEKQLKTDINSCHNHCAIAVDQACMQNCNQVAPNETPDRWKCTNACATQVINCYKGCAQQIDQNSKK